MRYLVLLSPLVALASALVGSARAAPNEARIEEISIWEEPSARVHWQFAGSDSDAEAALLAGVFTRLRAANVPVRADFYHHGFDPDPGAPTPDARQHVNGALLNRLLSAPDV